MSAKNGRPCVKCGGDEWYKDGRCAHCRREWSRNWGKANLEKKLGGNRKWRAANLEKERERKRKWRAANLEKVREQQRNWRVANPEKEAAKDARRRTRKTYAGGSYTAEEFQALCDRYGHRCLACRKKKKLEADHVVPVADGGSSDIDNIQPLCRTCNAGKWTTTIDYRVIYGERVDRVNG